MKKIKVLAGRLSIPLLGAGIALLVFLYSMMWIQLIGNHKLYKTTDFIAYYSAARIAQSQDSDQVYNLDFQKTEEEEILGYAVQPDEVNPFVHPPFVIPIVKLIINHDFLASYTRWALILIFIFIVNGLLLTKSLQESSGLSTAPFFCVSILFFPNMVSILNGQDSAILLLGGSLWLYGMVNKKFTLAGLGLALTTIRPQISLILALPFLFKDRKVFLWYLAGVIILAVFSLVTTGHQNMLGFLKMLTVSAGGSGYMINEFGMVNLLGLLINIFPHGSAEVLRYISWTFFLVAIIFGCFIWTRKGFSLESGLSVLVVVSLFFNPHLHFHDLVLLLIPLVCSIRLIRKITYIRMEYLTLGLLLLSFLLLANHLVQLPHIVAYSLMMLLVIGNGILGKNLETRKIIHEQQN